MQTLDWYYRRLKAMTPGEIAWRMRSSLRDCTDRFLVGWRQLLRKPSAILNGDGCDEGPGFRVSDMAFGNGVWLKTNDNVERRWYDALLAKADAIVEHRLNLLV